MGASALRPRAQRLLLRRKGRRASLRTAQTLVQRFRALRSARHPEAAGRRRAGAAGRIHRPAAQTHRAHSRQRAPGQGRRGAARADPLHNLARHAARCLYRRCRRPDAAAAARHRLSRARARRCHRTHGIPPASRPLPRQLVSGRLVPLANTAVSQMMDRGERITARVEHLRQSRDPWKRVGISIAARIDV